MTAWLSKPEYEQIIKDPHVLEFLNLPANEHYYEASLEQALIDRLQKFLLELGARLFLCGQAEAFQYGGQALLH